MLIQYRKTNPALPDLKFLQNGDWIDVRAAGIKMPDGNILDFENESEAFFFKKDDSFLIRLGFALKLPEGYEAVLAPRSSTFKSFGLMQTNSFGVIDNSYCGDNDEWMLPVFALRHGTFKAFDRIAQFRIQKRQERFELQCVESLGTPDRGGFGSTGVS